jgi:hypothetical protein
VSRRFPAAGADEPSALVDELEAVCAGRDPFEDLDALAELRSEVFELLGFDYGEGILYGIGFKEGLLDGVRVAQSFSSGSEPLPNVVGPPLPLLFRPEAGDVASRFRGTLHDCVEADVHSATHEPAKSPSCFVSAGYAAGWYSAILGRDVLVREWECAACHPVSAGDCSFEARDVEDWLASDPAWVGALLPFLDFDESRKGAELAALAEGVESDGEALAFDPSSPAIHVWGPVMVLPYGGPEDGQAALRVIKSDADGWGLQVAVLDLTGARIDDVEIVRVAKLRRALESEGLAVVIAGGTSELARSFPGDERDAPLLAPNVSQAIALAFQITRSSAAFS